MLNKIRFAHINLIAKDWQLLASFYQKIFGCIPVPPERDLSGQWLDAGTGVKNAHITGVHLRLPGLSNSGPTLEILSYDELLEKGSPAANRLGYGHLAFEVEDVPEYRKLILANGGKAVGEVVTVDILNAGKLTWSYLTDPEGNIIELQKWVK
jgi:predicted enzyme related to lactoylglutathione lyase